MIWRPPGQWWARRFKARFAAERLRRLRWSSPRFIEIIRDYDDDYEEKTRIAGDCVLRRIESELGFGGRRHILGWYSR